MMTNDTWVWELGYLRNEPLGLWEAESQKPHPRVRKDETTKVFKQAKKQIHKPTNQPTSQPTSPTQPNPEE